MIRPVRSTLPLSEPSHKINSIHAPGMIQVAARIVATLYR